MTSKDSDLIKVPLWLEKLQLPEQGNDSPAS